MNYTSFTPINSIQPLPSGLIVDLGNWTVGDIASMSDHGKGGNLNQLIGRCKVADDPRGVYGLNPGDPIPASKLMTVDRGVIIILQRIRTHWYKCGPHFEFRFNCIDEDCYDACSKHIPWTVDLRRFLLTEEDLNCRVLEKDEDPSEFAGEPVYLPGGKEIIWEDRFGSMPIVICNDEGEDKTAFIQTMSDEVLEVWRNGNEFEYLDPITKKILYWKIMQGTDEEAVRVHRKNKKKYVMALLGRRVVRIEDVGFALKASFLNQWDAGAQDLFESHTSELEPGMSREFDVSCPRCNLIQEVSFPLDTAFFSPSARKRRRGKK